jgi:hypothetical protein
MTTGVLTDRTERADRWLRITAVLYGLAFLVHTADHFRRGVSSSPWLVVLAGTLAGVAQVAAVAGALTDRRWAPLAAAVVGLADAVGVAAVHFITTPTAVTDPVVGAAAHVDAATPLAVAVEVGTSLAFGLAGLHCLRTR